MADDTLVVVAAYDDTYADNWRGDYPWDTAMWDTQTGGHPTGAYIDAYRAYPQYKSYLFVQDSMRPTSSNAEDVVAPFRIGAPVVAWCDFPMLWDGDEQAAWVRAQYPGQRDPARGIFGPVFYATREAMEQAEPHFPAIPTTKLEAQGTERAWAFCFQTARVPVVALYEFNPPAMQDGGFPPFVKTFANRQ